MPSATLFTLAFTGAIASGLSLYTTALTTSTEPVQIDEFKLAQATYYYQRENTIVYSCQVEDDEVKLYWDEKDGFGKELFDTYSSMDECTYDRDNWLCLEDDITCVTD